jgi:hypothetical protein
VIREPQLEEQGILEVLSVLLHEVNKINVVIPH